MFIPFYEEESPPPDQLPGEHIGDMAATLAFPTTSLSNMEYFPNEHQVNSKSFRKLQLPMFL